MTGRVVGAIALGLLASLMLVSLFLGYTNPVMTLSLDRLSVCF
ncbi:hypothetical protein [Roseospira visakhapatnamensis]|uniref:Uncharacterized protein n=1 Tax=Roseospira visakhapatnamensis TaxID=390880 RepID=A0A7W6W9C7_9PROT|nr:hypothetical protein [Roseospira visakhapatnamensis]MBB4265970.1 hypothetical protein [Roseospira visakhapatnamensis]